MLYGKLMTILLQIAAESDENDPDAVIAYYLLEQIHAAACPGIREVAGACSVSLSGVSRFCQDIGLGSYAELRELLADAQTRSRSYPDEPRSATPQAYRQRILDGINQAADTIDCEAIRRLARDINGRPQIAAFGYLKSNAAVLCLQNEMMAMGRKVVAKGRFHQQIEYIENARDDELILIFSHAGVYFDYVPQLKLRGRPTICMITGGQRENRYTDYYVRFRSDLAQETHPFQMQYAAGLIVQACREEEENRRG